MPAAGLGRLGVSRVALLLLLLLRLARHALPERVLAVLVRAVLLSERLAAVSRGELVVRLRLLRLALLGGAQLVLVLLRGLGLVLVRLLRHALAVGVLAVLAAAVLLREGLATVRRGEVLVRHRLLGLALLGGVRVRLLIVRGVVLRLVRHALAVRVLDGHLLGADHDLHGGGERLGAAGGGAQRLAVLGGAGLLRARRRVGDGRSGDRGGHAGRTRDRENLLHAESFRGCQKCIPEVGTR